MVLYHVVDLDEGIGGLQRRVEILVSWGERRKSLQEKDPENWEGLEQFGEGCRPSSNTR